MEFTSSLADSKKRPQSKLLLLALLKQKDKNKTTGAHAEAWKVAQNDWNVIKSRG